MNTMKIVFKSKYLIQDAQYVLKNLKYYDTSRKMIQYNDDIIACVSYENYYKKSGNLYTIYDISKGRYILPPFNRYSLCVREDPEHNEYLAFKNDDTNSYCLLFSDGYISEEYK